MCNLFSSFQVPNVVVQVEQLLVFMNHPEMNSTSMISYVTYAQSTTTPSLEAPNGYVWRMDLGQAKYLYVVSSQW